MSLRHRKAPGLPLGVQAARLKLPKISALQAIVRAADSLKWIANFRTVDFRFSMAAKSLLTSHTSVGDIPTLLGDLDGRAQTVQT